MPNKELEVGKRYVDEVGDVIHIYCKDKHPTHPFLGRVFDPNTSTYSDYALTYNKDGEISKYFVGDESSCNILREE